MSDEKAAEEFENKAWALDPWVDTTLAEAFLAGCAYGREQEKAKIEIAINALKYYADDKSWYLQKDKDTGAEVRRSIEYSDTESGSRIDDLGNNILVVNAGKRAKNALKQLEEKQ